MSNEPGTVRYPWMRGPLCGLDGSYHVVFPVLDLARDGGDVYTHLRDDMMIEWMKRIGEI